MADVRPLTSHERALLTHLLAVDVPDIGILHQQAEVAQARVDTELPWNVYFSVPRTVPPVTRLHSDRVSSAGSVDSTSQYAVDLLLWLDKGYLYSIEISWFEKQRETLPDVSELTPAEPAV